MKKQKLVTAIAKMCEVFLWIGTAVMLLIFITSFAAPDKLGFLIESGELTVGGLDIEVLDASGNVITRAVTMLALAGMLIMPLGAMICRNIYLIFRTAEGKTSFSKGATPFQEDIVRMVREIGIFSILIPVIELIVSIVARVVIGEAAAEISVSATGIFFGLVIVCLSRFFSYGESLQEEVDGLV